LASASDLPRFFPKAASHTLINGFSTILARVDDLPKSNIGKVLRKDLRQNPPLTPVRGRSEQLGAPAGLCDPA
jgi:hypothetical protein